ncbi:copper resistance protein CopC [Brevibacillus fortis]|uniref:copper resistance CopC family protein n=1 Tax=Brevibacillus fortis TaxID=2126352 RepID=UPI002E1DA2FC|nr:copper resistance protein CopC [Brevibacillus fortis]
MWKYILFFVVCTLFLFSQSVFAHTGLKTSSPQDKQTVEEVTEIVLEFNTKVEQKSTYSLTNEKGETIEIGSIQIDGKTMKSEVVDTLEDGSYTVNWKIVGADGHPIDGKFSFTVKNPNETQTPVLNNTNESGSSSATTAPVEATAVTQTSFTVNIAIIEVTILVVLALLCLVYVFRNKVR